MPNDLKVVPPEPNRSVKEFYKNLNLWPEGCKNPEYCAKISHCGDRSDNKHVCMWGALKISITPSMVEHARKKQNNDTIIKPFQGWIIVFEDDTVYDGTSNRVSRMWAGNGWYVRIERWHRATRGDKELHYLFQPGVLDE